MQEKVFFFPELATPHIKKGHQIKFWLLHTPAVEAQNGPLKPPPACLGLEVPNLEILRIGDLPGMSTNSSTPFHNHASILAHLFSRVQQNWP